MILYTSACDLPFLLHLPPHACFPSPRCKSPSFLYLPFLTLYSLYCQWYFLIFSSITLFSFLKTSDFFTITFCLPFSLLPSRLSSDFPPQPLLNKFSFFPSILVLLPYNFFVLCHSSQPPCSIPSLLKPFFSVIPSLSTILSLLFILKPTHFLSFSPLLFSLYLFSPVFSSPSPNRIHSWVRKPLNLLLSRVFIPFFVVSFFLPSLFF